MQLPSQDKVAHRLEQDLALCWKELKHDSRQLSFCFSALYLQFLTHSGTKQIFAESGWGERLSETLDLACTR